MVQRTINVATHNFLRYMMVIDQQDGFSQAAFIKGQENGQDRRQGFR